MPAAGATPNLQIAYLEAAQAQKHVTVNEALRLLDALVQTAAISRTVASQPAAPVDGDLYILPPGKTGGAWGAMADHALAHWRDGVWVALPAREGWTTYVRDEDQHVVFSGAAWGPLRGSGATGGNRLLNAAFALNQRGLASVGDDAYCFDRWYALASSGSVGVTPLADPESGRLSAIRLTQPDAAAKHIGLAQIVESANIRDLRARAVAMAARVRCSASQPVRLAVLEWTGAADAVTSDVVADWANTSFAPGAFFLPAVGVVALGVATPAAATWTDLPQVTGAFAAAMTNAIVLVWTETPLAQNATLDIDQVQLEAGTVCGPFLRRSAGEELALCQRYCQTLGPELNGRCTGATAVELNAQFKQAMRTTPAAALLTTTPAIVEIGVAGRTGAGSTLIHAINVFQTGGTFPIGGFSGLTPGNMAVGAQENIILLSAEL